jgi:putative toxin-antitoxin system antitoxin component (TIGR02293 family)
MPSTQTPDSIEDLIGVTPKSDFDLARIVERGLPTTRLALLKQHGLTFTEVSEIVISPRTLKHRKARRERLSDEETDRLVRVARIVALANSVFRNSQKALQWLRTESDRMGGRRPLSMLRTDAGGRLVESRLWQIDEGIFA